MGGLTPPFCGLAGDDQDVGGVVGCGLLVVSVRPIWMLLFEGFRSLISL